MFETAPTTRRVFLRRAAAAAFLATLKAAPAGAIRPLRRRRLAAREPWADIHARYLERISVSLARIDRVRGGLSHSIDVMDDAAVLPTETTSAKRERYYQILRDIDERWVDELR